MAELKLELEQLERIVIDEYYRLEAEAAVGGVEYIRIHEDVAKWFGQHASGLWDDLFGGKGRLALVSEENEEIRLRLMVLERLLERDIPFAYLERALGCSLVVGRVIPVQPAVRRVGVVQLPPPPVERKDDWLEVLRGWLSVLKRWLQNGSVPGPSPAQAAPSPSVPRQAAPDAPRQVAEPPLSDPLRRLLLLYRIMQDDPQGIVPPEQQLGPLDPRLTRHGAAARFYASDIGERIWNQRTGREGLARTPEELRRKLQSRNYVYEGAPRNAADGRRS